MSQHKNKVEQAYFANHLLEEFRTTIFRQTIFAAFERESHRVGEADDALTAETLSAAYNGLNQKYFGRICEVDREISYKWMRKPYFYRSFYVF